MDNITHTVIGLIAGEALTRVIPASDPGLEPETRRGAFIAATIIGGNLPDADLLYSYRGASTDRLGYLLEHRGYTHTLVGCVVLALLLYGGIEAWLHRHHRIASRSDHWALLAVSLIGTGLHLGMDALNSYGIHPFWPFQNRWIYGDSVFIVEPLYWAAAAPLIFLLRSTVARLLLGVLLVAGAVASIATGLVPWIMCLSLIIFTGCLLGVGWRARERIAALASAAAFVAVTGIFVVAAHLAAARVEAMTAADFPAAHTIDHVLSPMPVDPLCWDVLVLQTVGDEYVSRRATLALAPALIRADRCARFSVGSPTRPPQTAPSRRDATAIRWREFSMHKGLLSTLAASHCDAAALLRFARAPFAIADGTGWSMGDLRLERGTRPGMSDIRLGEAASNPARCPWTPPWEPPRADLLGR